MSFDFVQSARLTHTGMVMGTPYYMAPEQARGDSELDQRVDLWAVGVIMYESLTGRRPFVASNYNALLVKILTSTPRPLRRINADIPAPVEQLVERAMSKLREDRFQTARQFYEALTDVQRACAGDDDYAPTTVYRPHGVKREPAPTRREPIRRQQAGEQVDDPDTMIDDEMPGAEALRRVDAAGSLRALQHMQPSARGAPGAPSFEGLIDSEPTVHDDPRESAEGVEDTEVTQFADDEGEEPATEVRRDLGKPR
jgi:serine/threonine protein kinase